MVCRFEHQRWLLRKTLYSCTINILNVCMLLLSLIHFRPSGWDNMKKISILYENMHTCKPDDYYRDIIVQPTTRKVFELFVFLIVYVIFRSLLHRR